MNPEILIAIFAGLAVAITFSLMLYAYLRKSLKKEKTFLEK